MERSAETKSEYFAGEIYAMAGASERHNTIAMNVGFLLTDRFKGRPCKAYGSDLRVKIEPTGLYTYPDLLVVCGKPRFEDSGLDTLLNPNVIFEILSPSTEAYDRGAKFGQYRQIESLSDYVLIDQDRPFVEYFQRQPAGSWLLTDYAGLEAALPLPVIDCTLPLADIYDKVEFPESTAPRSLLRLIKEEGPDWQPASPEPVTGRQDSP